MLGYATPDELESNLVRVSSDLHKFMFPFICLKPIAGYGLAACARFVFVFVCQTLTAAF
jgi:hypothetical protein